MTSIKGDLCCLGAGRGKQTPGLFLQASESLAPHCSALCSRQPRGVRHSPPRISPPALCKRAAGIVGNGGASAWSSQPRAGHKRRSPRCSLLPQAPSSQIAPSVLFSWSPDSDNWPLAILTLIPQSFHLEAASPAHRNPPASRGKAESLRLASLPLPAPTPHPLSRSDVSGPGAPPAPAPARHPLGHSPLH